MAEAANGMRKIKQTDRKLHDERKSILKHSL